MSWSTVIVAIGLALLSVWLWRIWKVVSSPLPPEMQQKLEAKEQAKLDALQKEWSNRLGEEIRRVWEQMQGQVQTTDQSVSRKLEEANRTFAEVKAQLGKLEQATKQVEQVGRDVSSLQDLLRAPKMRGGFGEFLLADLLAQIMPADFYVLQCEFSDGSKVDAAVRLNGKLVPVDSKFPLDQFRKMGQAATDDERARCRRELMRDVKKHVDAIAEKYIRPSEGTFDFALMYIPSEGVYYEAVIKDDALGDEQGIFQHSVQKRVIPVSPNSFYAYLQVILLGLHGFRIEQRALEILSSLKLLHKELGEVQGVFNTAGDQLRNATRNFEKAEKHLSKFGDRLEAIKGGEPAAELPAPKQATFEEA